MQDCRGTARLAGCRCDHRRCRLRRSHGG
jgi:hypothetical protein